MTFADACYSIGFFVIGLIIFSVGIMAITCFMLVGSTILQSLQARADRKDRARWAANVLRQEAEKRDER